MRREALEQMLKTQDSHWWFRGKRRILGKIIEKSVFSTTSFPKLDILEVGCGTGSNLPMLARFGNVTALELDDYAREHIPPPNARGFHCEGVASRWIGGCSRETI